MILKEKVREETTKWVGARLITFAEFLEMDGYESHVELVDGVVEERSVVQLDHEKLLHWIKTVLSLIVDDLRLGILLGSRTAVEIHQFRGRLPDLLFVRQDRMEIVQQKAIYGAPDLVIEVISPGDRPSDVMALETDYRAIGVPAILFVDQRKHQVRILHGQAHDYREEVISTGAVVLEALGGLALEIEWLFSEPRPGIRATVDLLLSKMDTAEPG